MDKDDAVTKRERNTSLKGLINVINSAKTEHASIQNQKVFSKKDAQNALEKYINANQLED
jgi:hypothetical protein